MSNEYIEHDDVLDVRDIAGHIREAASVVDAEDCTEDEQAEALEALKAYADAFNDLTNIDHGEDWEALADAWDELDGPTMIRESYWVAYVQELATDIGAVGEGADWIVIDWTATADGVKVDYTEFDLDGETYYIRL